MTLFATESVAGMRIPATVAVDQIETIIIVDGITKDSIIQTIRMKKRRLEIIQYQKLLLQCTKAAA